MSSEGSQRKNVFEWSVFAAQTPTLFLHTPRGMSTAAASVIRAFNTRVRIRSQCSLLSTPSRHPTSRPSVQGPELNSRPRRLVLLDRDGVINLDVGSPGVLALDDLFLISGAAIAIAKLKGSDAIVCVVTNQTCVGKGLLPGSELKEIHSSMQELLVWQGGPGAVMDDIFVATSGDQGTRLKPGPDMLVEAIDAWGSGENERSVIVTMVGDSITDMQAAEAAGVTNKVLVGTGHGERLWRSLGRNVTFGRKNSVTSISLDKFDDRTMPALLPAKILPLTVCADLDAAVKLILDR